MQSRFYALPLFTVSLFFTDAEIKELSQKSDATQNEIQHSPKLSGIMFFNQDDWTLWIDNVKFTSEKQISNGYEILEVHEERVRLKINGKIITLTVKMNSE